MAFKKRMMPEISPRFQRIVQGFDAAAALITEQGIVAAAAEERFSGEKATGSFPIHAIQYCLQAGNLQVQDIDYLAHGFDYEPYRQFYEQSTSSREQFAALYAREAQIKHLQTFLPSHRWEEKFIQVPHHLAHAASTFYLSGFQEALILVSDGMGEAQSATVALGRDHGAIEIMKQIPSLHSLGILYGIFSLYLGFAINSDEYKVMGLAPYGDPKRYQAKVLSLLQFKNDGTYTIPVLYQNKTAEEKQTYSGTLRALSDLFGPAREPGSPLSREHMDLAAALQYALQESLLHTLTYFRRTTGMDNLCMAGGTALNCTANGIIRRSHLFKQIFIQPAAGDDGTALGAALYVQHSRQPDLPADRMGLPYWWPGFSSEEIEQALKQESGYQKQAYASFEELAQEVAGRLAAGQVVAWFQGRMEFGPRALGNRSILADPRDPEMRDHLNMLIKKREDFRPFAPAVTAEDAAGFFELEDGDESLHAYMLFVTQVRPQYQHLLPAITHVDGSARIQTVAQKDNPRFWTLLKCFEKLSSMPILLNTSFNLKDQPIVCTPLDALRTFLMSEIDILVLDRYVIKHAAPQG